MRKTSCLLGLLLIGFVACKKSGSSKSDCNVSVVTMIPTGGTPTVVSFTYDDDRKLKFLNTGSQSAEYTYYANGFKRRSTSGSGWYTNSFVELNSAGRPLTKKDSVYNNNQSLSQTYLYTFEYNNQGELMNIYKDNSPTPSETFTWSNGNMVKYKAGNTTYILDYYTDKQNRDFSLIDLQIFVSVGTNPAKSKNLLKSLTNNGEQLVFQYEFDSKGNIEKWTANLLGSPDVAINTTQQVICD